MSQLAGMRTRFTDDDEIFLKSLGERLRILRNRIEISQHNLATDSNVSKNQIGRIERAEISVSIVDLKNIAKALGFQNVGDFFNASLEDDSSE
ncbi:helix-turn-helix domain-containing protein [Flagellimonas sp.]|uniref:helix-turn-helix domain-containing protein n=1 Tax=Flagellimonas sp. TaxID=2058762 RepID=UPI003AB11EAF